MNGVYDDDGNYHIDDDDVEKHDEDNNDGHNVIVVSVLTAADQGWRQLSRITECAESNVELARRWFSSIGLGTYMSRTGQGQRSNVTLEAP